MRTKLCTLLVSAAATTLVCEITVSQEPEARIYLDAERLQAVICQLPGRVRRLGNLVTYPERGRIVETTAADCEIRGGEYTVFDRANYETALEIWKQAAESDPEAETRAKAQTYVGEIYEKRLGVPDYAEAARWYERAAENGSTRAMLNLAYLYEHGLGVQRDLTRALALWRDGMGIGEDLVLESELTAARTEAQRRIDALTAELDRQNQTSQRLEQQLAGTLDLLNDQRSSLETAQLEVNYLAVQLEEASSLAEGGAQLAALQRQLDERTGTVGEQQTRIALLETQIGSQRAQLEASASAAQIHEQRLRQALDDVARQEGETAGLTEALAQRDAQIRSLEGQIAAANASLDAQRLEQTELEAQIARLTRERPSDSAQSTAADAQLAALEEALERAKREVAASQGSVARMQQSLVAEREVFDRTLRTANVERGDLERELEQLRAERQEMEARFAQADSQAQALRAELSGTNEQLAAQELEMEQLREQIADAERSTGEVDAELVAQLERQLEQKQQEIAQRNAAVEELRGQWLNAKSQADSLRQEIGQQGGNSADLESKLKAQLSMLEQEIMNASMERQRLAAALDQQRREKEVLRAEKANVERRLAEAQASQQRDREGIEGQLKRMLDDLATRDAALAEKDRAILSLQADLREQSLEREGFLVERNLVASNLTRSFSAGSMSVQIPRDVEMERYRYHALVIGNWDYTYINDLNTVEQDVRTVKTLLEQRYGFSVDLRTNLDLNEMYGALNELRQYGENDFVLIYYAGHGTLDEFQNGYWQPVDYEPGKDASATAMSVGQITQHLNMMNARHVMVVADSCYSGALLRENSVEIQNVEQRLKHWINNASRTVLTSGGLSPVLDSDGGPHSAFASAFIDVLADNTGILSGEALHSRVRDEIRYSSQSLDLEQTPLFAGLADAGHANGQFVFVPR